MFSLFVFLILHCNMVPIAFIVTSWMQRSTRAVCTQNGPLTPCMLSTVHSTSVCSAPSTHPVHAQRSPLTLCVLSAVHSHSACSASSTHPVRAQHRPLTLCTLSTVHSPRARSARSTHPGCAQHGPLAPCALSTCPRQALGTNSVASIFFFHVSLLLLKNAAVFKTSQERKVTSKNVHDRLVAKEDRNCG